MVTMMRRLWMVSLALLAGTCLTVGLCWAADKDEKPDPNTDLANIGLAMKLADLGRQAGSPEALAGAARMLSEVKTVVKELKDVKPVEEAAPKEADLAKAPKAGPVIKGDSKTQDIGLTKQIKELKDEAKAMTKDKNLKEFIDSIPDNTRGTEGGPRTLPEKTVDVGKSHTFTFRWKGGEQARVVVTSDRNVLLHVHRTSDQHLEGAFQGKSVELYWTPGKDNDFTVRVTNTSGSPAKYSLFVN
jgi:hypothetical protein